MESTRLSLLIPWWCAAQGVESKLRLRVTLVERLQADGDYSTMDVINIEAICNGCNQHIGLDEGQYYKIKLFVESFMEAASNVIDSIQCPDPEYEVEVEGFTDAIAVKMPVEVMQLARAAIGLKPTKIEFSDDPFNT